VNHILGQALADLHKEEDGQDLVEYALVVALIALAATAGMAAVATVVNSGFTKVASILGQYIA
jgi:pilus assembly protein Flp/PilA